MTHEELVEKVSKELAKRHSTISREAVHWTLFQDEARLAIKITGEACWQEARLTWRECEGDAASAVDDVSNQIQSLTQGKDT